MGRWGDDIYDSDDALDYLLTITYRLERELVYWLAREVDIDDNTWLSRVLTVIELMLLFEQHRLSTSTYLGRSEEAMRRWRDVFLNVWDGDWKEPDKYDLASPEHRQKHRTAVIALFDRLKLVAHYWNDPEPDHGKGLPPISEKLSLPYFSISDWTDPYGRRFVGEMVEQLENDIIVMVSVERRNEILIVPGIDALWVAIDLLSFLCTTYDTAPYTGVQFIRNWRDTAIGIEKQDLADNHMKWDDDYLLYQQVLTAFDRLEAAAQKHSS